MRRRLDELLAAHGLRDMTPEGQIEFLHSMPSETRTALLSQLIVYNHCILLDYMTVTDRAEGSLASSMAVLQKSMDTYAPWLNDMIKREGDRAKFRSAVITKSVLALMVAAALWFGGVFMDGFRHMLGK